MFQALIEDDMCDFLDNAIVDYDTGFDVASPSTLSAPDIANNSFQFPQIGQDDEEHISICQPDLNVTRLILILFIFSLTTVFGQ